MRSTTTVSNATSCFVEKRRWLAVVLFVWQSMIRVAWLTQQLMLYNQQWQAKPSSQPNQKSSSYNQIRKTQGTSINSKVWCSISPHKKVVLNWAKPRTLNRATRTSRITCIGLRLLTMWISSDYLINKKAPRPGIEPGSPAWQAGILTTILTRICLLTFNDYKFKTISLLVNFDHPETNALVSVLRCENHNFIAR